MKDIKYYIELPTDSSFATLNEKCILAMNDDCIVGPKDVKKLNRSNVESNFVQINGDFSNYPTGIRLFASDWFRIIAKCPNLIDYLYDGSVPFATFKKKTTREIARNISILKYNEINNGIYKNIDTDFLPSEVVNSISYDECSNNKEVPKSMVKSLKR